MRRHIEHLRSAAVVIGERQHGRLVECIRQAAKQHRVGAVPAVDGLQWVANDEHIVTVAAQCFEKCVLQRVHVLRFVDEEMSESESSGSRKVGAFVDGPCGQRDEVV